MWGGAGDVEIGPGWRGGGCGGRMAGDVGVSGASDGTTQNDQASSSTHRGDSFKHFCSGGTGHAT